MIATTHSEELTYHCTGLDQDSGSEMNRLSPNQKPALRKYDALTSSSAPEQTELPTIDWASGTPTGNDQASLSTIAVDNVNLSPSASRYSDVDAAKSSPSPISRSQMVAATIIGVVTLLIISAIGLICVVSARRRKHPRRTWENLSTKRRPYSAPLSVMSRPGSRYVELWMREANGSPRQQEGASSTRCYQSLADKKLASGKALTLSCPEVRDTAVPCHNHEIGSPNARLVHELRKPKPLAKLTRAAPGPQAPRSRRKRSTPQERCDADGMQAQRQETSTILNRVARRVSSTIDINVEAGGDGLRPSDHHSGKDATQINWSESARRAISSGVDSQGDRKARKVRVSSRPVESRRTSSLTYGGEQGDEGVSDTAKVSVEQAVQVVFTVPKATIRLVSSDSPSANKK